MKDFLQRLELLRTGNATWIDTETGEVEHDHFGWRDRWSLFGVHSHNWKWVHRYGKLGCGCTRNPLTRRMVLLTWGCPLHCGLSWTED